MRLLAICLSLLSPLVLAAPDAGVAALDAGPALVAQPVPVFAIAEKPEPFDTFAITKAVDRPKVKGLLNKVTIGKRVMLAIFLDNYTLPSSRRVDLSADVVITDPNGRVTHEQVSAAQAKTLDPKTMFTVPLKPGVPLSLGLTDPEGTWKISITIWDLVRGSHSRLDSTFLVTR